MNWLQKNVARMIFSAMRSPAWGALLEEAVSLLAGTVKNKQSMDAARLINGVRLLRGACDSFLARLGVE